jgi:UPF0716 protein FxsA
MGLFLVIMFLVVPIVEIYVIVQVGQEIGALPTVVLLIVESLIGAWLVRREGTRAWAALRIAVTSGQLPSRELADAALVTIGGTLLLTPGFVTDIFGFFFVLPLTRPVARRLLAGFVARRATVAVSRLGPMGPGAGPTSYGPYGTYDSYGPRGSNDDRVVPGEVVDGHRGPDGTDEPDDPGHDSERPGRSTG